MAGLKVYIWPRKALQQAAEAAASASFDETQFKMAYAEAMQSEEAKVLTINRPQVDIETLPSVLTIYFRKIDVLCQFLREKSGRVETIGKRVFGSVKCQIKPPSSVSDQLYVAYNFSINLKFEEYLKKIMLIESPLVAFGPDYFPQMPCFEGAPDARPGTMTVRREKGLVIESSKNNDSVCLAGTNQMIYSRAFDATLVASGINCKVWSFGRSADILCTGTNGHVRSLGAGAMIRETGKNLGIEATGPDAVVFSSGSYTSITLKGLNSKVFFSGNFVQVKSSVEAINDDLGKLIVERLKQSLLEHLNSSMPNELQDNPESLPITYQYGSLQDNKERSLESLKLMDMDRMITLIISNDAFVDLFRAYFILDNTLHCNLTQDGLICQPSADNMSKMTSLCDIFPELYSKYAYADIEINLRSYEIPMLRFSATNLKVIVCGSAALQTVGPDGSNLDILLTNVEMEVDIVLALYPHHLRGTVTSWKPTKMTIVKTKLDRVSPQELDDYAHLIGSKYLLTNIHEICHTGIDIRHPLLSKFSGYKDIVMSATANGLRIDADATFLS